MSSGDFEGVSEDGEVKVVTVNAGVFRQLVEFAEGVFEVRGWCAGEVRLRVVMGFCSIVMSRS